MLRLVLVMFVGLSSWGPSAQGDITAVPNPYDLQTDTSLVVRVTGTSPVTVDSLRFASHLAQDPWNGWGVTYTAYVGGDKREGGFFCEGFAPSSCGDDYFVGLSLAPSDSVVFTDFGLGCLTCREGGRLRGGGFDDTLYVYTSGADEPLLVEILNGVVVGSDPAPTASALRLDVYPNPAQERITVRLDVETASELEAIVYDAMGRRVATSSWLSFAAGSAAVPIYLGDLPSGVYTVEVRGRLATGGAVKRSGSFVVAE